VDVTVPYSTLQQSRLYLQWVTVMDVYTIMDLEAPMT